MKFSSDKIRKELWDEFFYLSSRVRDLSSIVQNDVELSYEQVEGYLSDLDVVIAALRKLRLKIVYDLTRNNP